jgi:hypothetical protein
MSSRGLGAFLADELSGLGGLLKKAGPTAAKGGEAALSAERKMVSAPGRAGGATLAAPEMAPISYTPRATDVGMAAPTRTVSQVGLATPPTAPDKGFMQSLGITNPSSALGTAALLGGMGLYSGKQAQKAQEQGQAMVGQEKAIAQPYQIQGREMAQQALAGDMTPATQQAYKAAQAQIQQNVATSGGVGQQQAGIQLEAFRQQLLQNQYQYGIQVSQIGDNIALGAIQDSMQLNQNLNSISNSFYSNLGNIAAMSMGNYNPYGLQQPQTITK